MRVASSPFLNFGLPFLSFMVGGSYALKYVIGGRYELRDEVEKQKKLLLVTDGVTLPARTSQISAADAAAAVAASEVDYEIVRIARPPDSH